MIINLKETLLLSEDRNNTVDRGCIMAECTEEDANIILNFNKKVINNEEDLYKEINKKDGKEEFARETNVHLTIKYGFLKDLNEIEIRQLLQGQKQFWVELYKLDKFESNPKFDVVILRGKSDELNKLHNLAGVYPNDDKYPEYKPHLTLSYVKKGHCKNLLNKDISNFKVLIKKICYSPILGEKSYFDLPEEKPELYTETNIHSDIDNEISKLEQEWDRLDDQPHYYQRQREITKQLQILRRKKELNQSVDYNSPKAKELWDKLKNYDSIITEEETKETKNNYNIIDLRTPNWYPTRYKPEKNDFNRTCVSIVNYNIYLFRWTSDNEANIKPWNEICNLIGSMNNMIVLTNNKNVILPDIVGGNTKWEGSRNILTPNTKEWVKILLDNDLIIPNSKIYIGNWASMKGQYIGNAKKISEYDVDKLPRKMTFYHGTSDDRLEKIKIEGLKSTPLEYRVWKSDVLKDHPEYREHAVYLTYDIEKATYYARKAVNVARRHNHKNTKMVILKITIPRSAYKKLLPDDDYLMKQLIQIGVTWMDSLKNFSQVAYLGTIPPEWIKIKSIEPYGWGDNYKNVKENISDNLDQSYNNKEDIITIKDVEKALSYKYLDRSSKFTLEMVEEWYYSEDKAKNEQMKNYLNLLNKVGKEAFLLGKEKLHIPFIEINTIKSYLLNQAEFRSNEDDFFPFPLYVSSNQSDEATIGIMIDRTGKVLEIHEGNDEATPESINMVNKLLNPSGKKVRIYASHDRNLVFKIDETDTLPKNLYVSPDMSHAKSHMDLEGNRETFTGIIDINNISQESDLDWKTIEPTKIEKFRFI